MEKDLEQLLLKDLCSRLPYGVKILEGGVIIETLQKIEKVSKTLHIVNGCGESIGGGFSISQVKPYLRPISSMTEEEKDYYDSMFIEVEGDYFAMFPTTVIDYLNSHHFDYRGLIPMGLALEAKEGMYETK